MRFYWNCAQHKAYSIGYILHTLYESRTTTNCSNFYYVIDTEFHEHLCAKRCSFSSIFDFYINFWLASAINPDITFDKIERQFSNTQHIVSQKSITKIVCFLWKCSSVSTNFKHRSTEYKECSHRALPYINSLAESFLYSFTFIK